jgi:tRNA1Val (adenine37-N6)-methyltransferase
MVHMVERNTFHFKRFAVDQTGCAMKVGTDGVLLGAWCRLAAPAPKAILDVGTGSGVIALQLAQRTEGEKTRIDAIEIDPAACETARRNFEASEWGDRLTAYRTAAQEFAAMYGGEKQYDLIVSNPPYFVDSLASPDRVRNLARHAGSLSYDELIALCNRLLTPDGRVSLIVPAGAETQKMIATAEAHGFAPSRITTVHSTPKSGAKRTLIEFSRRIARPAAVVAAQTETAILTIHDENSDFSDEYRELTRDFYLYF